MKYKVKDGKQIRLREADKVTALAVGTLASGEVFDAEIVRDDAMYACVGERFGVESVSSSGINTNEKHPQTRVFGFNN